MMQARVMQTTQDTDRNEHRRNGWMGGYIGRFDEQST